jgi:chemotaxis protein histidine kinase CheA
LELNWSPIHGEDELVEKLLVSIKDVTELRRLEQEAREQRRDLELIGQILALPRHVFLEFMRDTDGLLDRSESLIGRSAIQADAQASLFRHMHTIKGNARTYGFESLAQAAHEAEETYAKVRYGVAEDGDTVRMQSELAKVRECLHQYRRVYEHTLESFGGMTGQTTAVDNALLEQLRTAIAAARTDELPLLIDAIGTSTLEEIVSGLVAGARGLARQLDKPVPTVRSSAPGIRFRQAIVPVLRDVFMHILRNAVDHGLEPLAERRERGKPECGEIAFVARPCAEGCEIRVHDDGRGLPIARLREIANKASLPAESDAELMALVFRSGVTSAEAISDISGRGVGMDAIRRFVVEHGGDVQLELLSGTDQEHAAFAIRIVLPRQHFVEMSARAASKGVEPGLPTSAINVS